MPKNTACPGVPRVTDPITDQEIAFAHLVLSGTMTDRRAAEAVGLNPETAAYTKAKPRVRAYMLEHRAAVREKLVDQEADGLRKLNLGRDQILTRLWELATLSHETTRGTIAGQIKALSMIVAIEGLIPSGKMNDRRLSSATQPVAPPVKADIDPAAWFREQQHQAADEEPGNPVATGKAQPAAPRPPAPDPPSPLDSMFEPSQPSVVNPFIIPQPLNRASAAIGSIFDAVLHPAAFPGLSFSPQEAALARPHKRR